MSMWQFLARKLLASLEHKAKQQVVSKILGKNTSSFLNLVKNNYKPQKVESLFNRKLRLKELKRVLNKLSLTKKVKLRKVFKKTLAWDYIKKQIWFAKNQMQVTPIFSSSKVSGPVANARAIEQSILRRLILTNKKKVVDRSPLNSSWIHYGVWEASTAQEDYWTGILHCTVKHEYKDGSVAVGRTYPKHNFSLTSWSLMRSALGRDGTGAGTVYWQDKRGWIGGKEVRAGRWSSQA